VRGRADSEEEKEGGPRGLSQVGVSG
jgi:hypothetical protein